LCTLRPTRSSQLSPQGFTLLELTIVLVIAALTMAVAASVFSSYQARTSARRAAQVFQRDLTLARSSAMRARDAVTVLFDEDSLLYSVASQGGRTYMTRHFGPTWDLNLTEIDLDIPGDSVVFNSRGVADLRHRSTREAVFAAGETEYVVTFNAMGASRLEQR
jgi:prepilin-type N-terminal cleavage/methylation domain-containing protein